MRRSKKTLCFGVASILLGACAGGAGGRVAPAMPPRPTVEASELQLPHAEAGVVTVAAPAAPIREVAPLLGGGQLLLDFHREGARLWGPLETTAEITAVSAERITLAPEKDKPLDLLLRLPPEMPATFVVGEHIEVLYQPSLGYGDLERRLVLKRGKTAAVEVGSFHGQTPIARQLLDGALGIKQTERVGAGERDEQVERWPMAVEILPAGGKAIALKPGARVDVATPAGSYRVWVAGSVELGALDGKQGVFEGQPYQLTVVVVPTPQQK